MNKTKIEIRSETTENTVLCEVERLSYENWQWDKGEKGYVREMGYQELQLWLDSDSKLKPCCEIVEKWATDKGAEGGFF